MKTDNSNLRLQAVKAFDKGDFSLALAVLSQIDVADSWKELTGARKRKGEPDRWFRNKKFDQFFWNSGLSSDLFHKLLTSDISHELLFRYFTHDPSTVGSLPSNLIGSNPAELIQAIRTSQAFIRPGWEERIDGIQLPENLVAHKHFWQIVRKDERRLWSQVESALMNLEAKRSSDVWLDLLIYMERERYIHSHEQHTYFLTRTYGGLIELLGCGGFFEGLEKETMEGLQKTFIEKLRPSMRAQTMKTAEKSPVDELAKHFYHWLNFKECIIDLYSFSLEYEPAFDGKKLTLSSTPEEHYKFVVDGSRYHLNELHYYMKSDAFVEYMSESQGLNIPIGRLPIDRGVNSSLAVTNYSTVHFLSDLGISAIGQGKEKNTIFEWIAFIVTYSFNRKVRYEWPLQQKRISYDTWDDAFISYLSDALKDKSASVPVEAYTQEGFIAYILNASPNSQADAVKQIVKLSSFEPHRQRDFNRFGFNYDPWQKPFLRVQDSTFIPTFLLATNGWFYSLAQIALEHQKCQAPDREETKDMEKVLVESFGQKSNWNSELLADESEGMVGDVDIQISDGADTLWIQLKRVYFRLTPKARNSEKLQSETKAVQQLNLAEFTLINRSVNGPLQQPPTMKWIVSTSFENIGASISGCNKINYFELLRALGDPNIKTLRQLEESLLQNRELMGFCSAEFNNIKGIGLDLLLPNVKELLMPFDQTSYSLIIHDSDDERYAILALAQEKEKRGDKSGACAILEQYLAIYPEDANTWAELGNIQADLRNFDAAVASFKMCIELAPRCPAHMRNLALTYFEAGNFESGFELYLQLFELYPLLVPLRIEILENWKKVIRNGGLKVESVNSFYSKMIELGLV